VDSVNFSVSVGTTVPTSVRVVEVPDVLIRIHPEWRGHRYFVVRDEIIIVDNSHKIVSVVPVGSSGGAQLDNRDRGSASVRSGGAMNLSVEEIREVQQVLVREGFDVEVDGKLGPKTHEALISFQRKNGLQATGQIDSQTVTKLNVNVRSSTTGQGGGQGNNQGNMPREQGQQGRQDQQGGDRNNQRSDQDRRDGNAPSNTQGRGDQRSEQNRNDGNAPSTTGQGGQQKGGERSNMPKSQQDGNQKGSPSNREQQK
jgi:peptidoglycan hydrolase-like protein with peptidoglycan-binding domain